MNQCSRPEQAACYCYCRCSGQEPLRELVPGPVKARVLELEQVREPVMAKAPEPVIAKVQEPERVMELAKVRAQEPALDLALGPVWEPV